MPTADERRQINAIVAEGKQAIERTAIRLVLGLGEELVTDTPVDTGWAESNWIPTINVRLDAPIADKQNVDVARREQQAAFNTILGYRLEQGQIHLQNNVPYIGLLNNGHSAQAPAGYVQRDIIRALRGVRQVRSVL